MKRTIMMTALLLMAVMGMQAQSLLGTWKSETTTDEDGDKTTWTFVFAQNNKTTMIMTLESSDEEVGDMVFSMNIPGTYKRNGNTLTMNLDAKSAKAKMEKIAYKGELANMVKESPKMKEAIDEMIQNKVDEEMKKGFADETPFDGEVTINKLTATTLELGDGEDVVVLTRQR